LRRLSSGSLFCSIGVAAGKMKDLHTITSPTMPTLPIFFRPPVVRHVRLFFNRRRECWIFALRWSPFLSQAHIFSALRRTPFDPSPKPAGVLSIPLASVFAAALKVVLSFFHLLDFLKVCRRIGRSLLRGPYSSIKICASPPKSLRYCFIFPFFFPPSKAAISFRRVNWPLGPTRWKSS